MTYIRIYSAYLAMLAALIVAFPKLIALGLILFLPLLAVGLMKKQLIFSFSGFNMLFVSFYVLYALYVMFTRHSDWAGTYLENKLSFVLFPFLFSFLPKSKVRWNWSAYSFVASSIMLVFSGLIHSYSCNALTNNPACFFTTSFSYIHHPTYAAVFFTVAVFLLWYLRFQRNTFQATVVAILGTLILVLGILLCLSFAGLLYFLLATGIAFLILINKRFGKKVFMLTLVVLPVLLFLVIRYEPHLRGEYLNAKQFAVEYAHDPEAFIRTKKYPMSGSEVRLVMWTAAYQAAKDFPLGVGTGNVDEVLGTYLRRMDQKELAAQNYNPHNQYFQTSIEIGVLGLINLLLILGVALRFGWKHRNWLLLLIVGSLTFNMLFESMLQRQSGIVFYTFAICLLVFYQKMKSQRDEDTRVNL